MKSHVRLVVFCLVFGLFAAAASAGPIYRLKSHEDSTKCLDVQGSSGRSGANVQVHSCHTGNNQRWELRDVLNTPNFYVIEAVHSGKCLDVKGASHSNHANVQQYNCYNNHSNQEWEKISVGAYVAFKNRQSSKCLDVRQNPYGNAQQYTCTFDNNQLWILDTVSACGNGLCEPGETCSTCPDCSCVCGDGVCNGSETSSNCPLDCGPYIHGGGDGLSDGDN